MSRSAKCSEEKIELVGWEPLDDAAGESHVQWLDGPASRLDRWEMHERFLTVEGSSAQSSTRHALKDQQRIAFRIVRLRVAQFASVREPPSPGV